MSLHVVIRAEEHEDCNMIFKLDTAVVLVGPSNKGLSTDGYVPQEQYRSRCTQHKHRCNIEADHQCNGLVHSKDCIIASTGN